MTHYTRTPEQQAAHKLRVRLSALTPGTPEWDAMTARLNTLTRRA